MGLGPFGAVDPALAAAADARSERTERALQAGWAIRYDPMRDEYTAARELHAARTLDGLLDAIEQPDAGPELELGLEP